MRRHEALAAMITCLASAFTVTKIGERPGPKIIIDAHRLLPEQKQRNAATAALSLAVLSGLTALTPTAQAVENAAAVGRCVLTECQVPLVKCIGNPKCAANLVW